MVLMRFTDIFLALPSFLLMVVLNTLFSPGMVTLIAVLSLFSWASVARITRAETMSLKQKDFVLAAKSMGASHTEIIFKHIIPNMSASIIVAGSLGVAGAILTESSLSFLRLGVQRRSLPGEVCFSLHRNIFWIVRAWQFFPVF